MAMGSGGSGTGLSSDINVTPMIDVLLVLLIIFMITLPLSRRAFDMQVPVEQRDQPKQKTQSDQIVLELRADGTYAVNNVPVTLPGLDAKLHEVFDQRPVKLMFIKAAPNRKYREVIEAMDIARGAGVQVMSFTPADQAKPAGR
ncbi:MAG TPA: biopolymer transporter ExbD [Gemmatimonadales bacterium]|jgi:biopolymer transport protein ExbD